MNMGHIPLGVLALGGHVVFQYFVIGQTAEVACFDQSEALEDERRGFLLVSILGGPYVTTHTNWPLYMAGCPSWSGDVFMGS